MGKKTIWIFMFVCSFVSVIHDIGLANINYLKLILRNGKHESYHINSKRIKRMYPKLSFVDTGINRAV